MIDCILLDMDGVVADFVGGAIEAHKSIGSQIDTSQYSLGLDDNVFWQPISAAGYVFWAKLEPLPWMRPLVELIQSYAPWEFCTKPSNDPFCAAGKILWIKRHFGDDFKDYILAKHKHHLSKPGYVLIDDHDENIAEFNAKGGRGILFPQPWNANYGLCHNRLEYVMRELEKLRDT